MKRWLWKMHSMPLRLQKKAGFSTAAVYDKANKEQEKIRETADIYLKSFDEQLTEMITGRM
jgi:hypothetical protein